ncbi:MAG: matrixin family metalloprotease, partial [Bryobacterales bacterium]|nr:matrixin family metalloprotease [Bryobacterales bacterium]
MTQPCQFTSPASLPFPPLPEELSVPDTPDPAAASDELRRFFRTGAVLFDTGAYLLNFQPVNQPLITYDGTLRMIRGNALGGFTASGDLYQRLTADTPNGPVLQPPPDPRRGIPILPLKQYRLYLRVTDLPATGFFTGGRARFGFELYRFNSSNNTWAQEPGGTFRADLALRPTPPGFVNSADFFDGDVTNAAGAFAGRMSMGWVSSFFRRAAVEFDRVKDADDVDIATFQRAFLDAGWEVSFFTSNSDVQEPNGEFWSDAEMHQALLARRDSADLDSEWRFHLLAVRRISSTERGVMFDTGATDSNKVPREGAGISCNWVIPNADPWGLVKGQRFGATGNPYVRTAVHEIGHAMGLVHNTVDNGIMNATNVIASNGTAQLPFPNNIVFQFHPDDTRRLRHYPDV